MCIHVYRGTTKPDSLWALWWRGWEEQVLGKISAVEKWNSLHFCITRVQNSYGFHGHIGLKQHKCFLHITGSDGDGDEDWEDLPAVWIEVFLLFWAFWLKLFVNLRWKSQGLQICGWTWPDAIQRQSEHRRKPAASSANRLWKCACDIGCDYSQIKRIKLE